ncbi:MAG: ATP-binding cassette domain-containing protein [Proteobacteria bacterium]|nr:ATP-binding cassette domain-containing protein [Pseudomonadota bacterium]
MANIAIRMQGVRFRWRPQDPIVLDIPEFQVAKGEKIFIKGPSGSGKTSLLNLLAGVARPEAGDIDISGHRITAFSGRQGDTFRADHIGFIFQMFNLLPYLSMLNNVTLACLFSDVRRQRALGRAPSLDAEASRLLQHLELDVSGLASRPVSLLSMGQQQRVAVARSLIGGPDLVIADEPTSALDADARQSFLDLLFREIAETGSTLLFVSHDAGLADSFDRSLAIADFNMAETER